MMSSWELVLNIARNVAFIGIGAYLTTRLPSIRRTLTQTHYGLSDQLILGFVFGVFSVLGNWLGIPILGAIANSRIVGPVAGGLMGGPVVGVCAGVIGAVPRYFMGGFTMWAAVLSNIIVGLVSGMVYRRFGPRRINLKTAIITAIGCELILKLMILTMSKPFEAALALEKAIAAPTIIANSLAVGFFVYIVRDVFNEQEKVQALSAQQVIRMLRNASGLMQAGLNETTAFQVAQIIYKETKAAAVAVTDTDKVLAFIGEGSDHHRTGTPIVTAATQRAMRNRQTVIVSNREGIGCPNPNCRLTAVIDAPIVVNDELLGSIKLYKANDELVSPYESELIQGIADIICLQLAHQKLAEQQMLLLRAEYNMLKAQVSPHFFFNTLGTIQALVQTSPEMASSLIKDLADFFRRTLKRGAEIVTLREELESVQTYFRIEKIRFGDRIKVIESIPARLFDHPVPVFTLQPLVENAVRHGISIKKGGGFVQVSAWHSEQNCYIKITDNGVGIAADRLSTLLAAGDSVRSAEGIGIGVTNVHKRLQKLYGDRYGLTVRSLPGHGTEVTICLPLLLEEDGLRETTYSAAGR